MRPYHIDYATVFETYVLLYHTVSIAYEENEAQGDTMHAHSVTRKSNTGRHSHY